MSRPVVAVHPMAFPLSSMGKELAIVEVRRPTWGDIRKASTSDDPGTALIVACTGIPTTDVLRMDAADGMALDAIIGGFLAAPGTSAQTSEP